MPFARLCRAPCKNRRKSERSLRFLDGNAKPVNRSQVRTLEPAAHARGGPPFESKVYVGGAWRIQNRTPNPDDRPRFGYPPFPMPDSSPSAAHTPALGRSLRDVAPRAVWPRLLATARLAAAPSRLLLGTLLVVALGLVSKAPTIWLAKDAPNPMSVLSTRAAAATAKLRTAIFDFDLGGAVSSLTDAIVGSVTAAFRVGPWSFLSVMVPALILCGIIGGAIARSAAVSFVGRGTPRGVDAAIFALKRAKSFGIVLLAPWIVVGLLCLLLAILGWAGLSIAYVQVVGAVLSGVSLLLAAIIFALVAAYAVGAAMLPAALACEGTDAIDAVQRVVAYSWARPGRMLACAATLLIQAIVVAVVLGAAIAAIKLVAASSLTVWVADDVAQYLKFWLLRGEAPYTMTIAETGSLKATGRILGFWGKVPLLLVAGYFFSFLFSGGTIWYLIMRLVCDGQEPEELWSPSAAVQRPDDGEPGPADD